MNLRGVDVSRAALFFGEPEALFGNRTDVKPRHDRHANIEATYLLQHLETYDGIAIVATNRQSVKGPSAQISQHVGRKCK